LKELSWPTAKQQLAAIRKLFDWLVIPADRMDGTSLGCTYIRHSGLPSIAGFRN
jgi:hypothetical protein